MKILATTAQLLVTLCLVAMGAIFVASMAPIPGGIQSKIVQSGSMEPHIAVGAMVVIKPAAQYRPGDVITFATHTGAIPTTHRIVALEGSGADERYTTKGDANEEPDPAQVLRASVVGKVVLTLPYVGYVLHFARQPLGFALLIGLPAVLVMIEESMSLWGQWRNRQKKPLAPRTLKPAEARRVRRLRVSDDMFVYAAPRMRTARGGIPAGVVSALVILAVLGIGTIGQTVSVLNDTEYAAGNTLAAGTWGILPAREPFVSPFSVKEEVQDAPSTPPDETAPDETPPALIVEDPVVGDEAPADEVPAPEPDAAPLQVAEDTSIEEPVVESPGTIEPPSAEPAV